ncbi:AzlC family ABC transporter permease [Roseovarius sp. SYSU LYC5161]|uniref:AzlC family ABC transporter permease n=1 Tax=Roseovarius halophilus (ex Wu et al. 2025) TaxID=3376060 RepID=UPI00399AF4F6
MPTETTKSIFLRGVKDGSPFILVLVPFSTLFGVVATEAGLDVFQALSFSVAVLAGAAQFTALQLLADDAPTFIAILSGLAVNLRMAMYSAALTPYLGPAPLWQRAFVSYFTVDQTYACSALQYELNPDWTIRQRLAYFFGVATPLCPFWYSFTVVGAMVGTAIPGEFALDFAIPITFIALIAPMLRTWAHVAAALTSVVVALILASLPYNLGLMVAAVAAMMAGAQVELWAERRRARQGQKASGNG